MVCECVCVCVTQYPPGRILSKALDGEARRYETIGNNEEECNSRGPLTTN